VQEKVIPVAKKTVPGVPSNGYQFKKDWQYLNDNFEHLSEYFKVFELFASFFLSSVI